MSDIKIKARVVLTDDEGRHLGECEIITDSEEIFYNNATPMPNAVGELPAGTTFDRYSVSRIIDALLYKKGSPSFGEIIFSNAEEGLRSIFVCYGRRCIYYLNQTVFACFILADSLERLDSGI